MASYMFFEGEMQFLAFQLKFNFQEFPENRVQINGQKLLFYFKMYAIYPNKNVFKIREKFLK